MIARYVVKPRPRRDGFSLSGPKLPYPLWYVDDLAALSYAHHMLREHTLWGGDQLLHGADRSRTYLDQPGYRYYLAAAIAPSRGVP